MRALSANSDNTQSDTPSLRMDRISILRQKAELRLCVRYPCNLASGDCEAVTTILPSKARVRTSYHLRPFGELPISSSPCGSLVKNPKTLKNRSCGKICLVGKEYYLD